MSAFLNLQVQVVETATRSGVKEVSTMDIISNSNAGFGWLINLALLAIFGFSVYIFAQRSQALKRAMREEEDFLGKIKSLLLEGNFDAAKKYCSNSESPSARMLEKGIARIGKPMDSIAASIENARKLEIITLKQRLTVLAMASGIAPMLGLLGTAMAFSGVFNDLQLSGTLDVQLFAPGSSAALVTTIEGLLVGIFSFGAYYFLLSRIEQVVYQMESDAVQFMELLD